MSTVSSLAVPCVMTSHEVNSWMMLEKPVALSVHLYPRNTFPAASCTLKMVSTFGLPSCRNGIFHLSRKYFFTCSNIIPCSGMMNSLSSIQSSSNAAAPPPGPFGSGSPGGAADDVVRFGLLSADVAVPDGSGLLGGSLFPCGISSNSSSKESKYSSLMSISSSSESLDSPPRSNQFLVLLMGSGVTIGPVRVSRSATVT